MIAVVRAATVRRLALMLVLALALFSTNAAWADTGRYATQDEANTVQIFKDVSPSVVSIINSQAVQEPFSPNAVVVPAGSGSGFVLDKSGLVLTNAHVVEKAAEVTVVLPDGTTVNARPVGVAPEKDIALLKIDAPPAELKPVTLGKSSDLEVGQKVLAIGNPFQLNLTLTTGVISALNREIQSPIGRRVRGVIQTDAPINPGNSGGPLLDSHGRVIGMNTAILSPGGTGNIGIGFAIPVDTIRRVVPQLIKYGHMVRPVLGISVADAKVSQTLGIPGVIVTGIAPGSGAAKAGITAMQRKPDGSILLGDVIVGIGNEKVQDPDSLLNALEQHSPGDTVTVHTMRKGKPQTYKVKLGST